MKRLWNKLVSNALFHRELWRRRPIQMLSSATFIYWAIALGNPQIEGTVYGTLSYLPWPWRAIACGIIGLSWPVLTTLKGEQQARYALGIQGLLLVYTSVHFFSLATATGFGLYFTLGMLVLDQRSKTPRKPKR